jgi:membrane protein
MAKASAEPRGPDAHIERAIAWLYRWLAANRYTRFPWAVVQTFSQAEGSLLSGSIAYYTFLSLLPLLMVAAFVIGSIASTDPNARTAVIGAFGQVFPGIDVASVLEPVLDQVIQNRAALGVFGLLSVAYASSGFVGAMTACMNRMWEVESGRNPVGQKLLNILVVALLGTVLLGSVSLTVWVSATAQRALDVQPTSPLIGTIEEVGGPTSLLLVLLLLYRLLPARRHSWLSQLPGALFGAVGIEVLKRGFAYWAGHSAGIGALPRSLVTVVLLLIWLGFFAQLILYGAALNVVLDRQRRELPLLPNPPAGKDDGARGREGASGPPLPSHRGPAPGRRRQS